MSIFSLVLFGSIEITIKGQNIANSLTDKERAMLGYLVVETSSPQRRETLASLFWPDRPERVARQNLRQALYHIHKVIGDYYSLAHTLLVNAETIQFNHRDGAWVDVIEFTSLLSAFRLHHPDGGLVCPACLQLLKRAVGLFRGEYMEAFTLRDTPQFDLWQTIHREAYHLQTLDTLNILMNHYMSQRDFPNVVSTVLRMIEIEPWLESAHHTLMWVLAVQGRRCEALRQYELFSTILRQEMGLEPSEKINRLYTRIRDGESLDSGTVVQNENT